MADSFVVVGLVLFGLGFLLLLLVTILSVLGRGSDVRKGAVIMIGPLPIVFADDPKIAKTLIVLAIVLTVISFLFFALTVKV